jgi:CRISPR/Cas system-associated exonuclease Cas4 (RecB family)
MVELEDWYYRYNAWSFSKHRLWSLCKRAYYYRYIGTAMKESEELDIPKLKRLKDLDPRFALQGKLIHEVLENQIGQHYLGRELSEKGAKVQYTQRVEQYRKMAKETLIESFNGETIDEKFFDNIRAKGIDQISMFFGVIWPQLKDLEYLRHEKFDRFKVGDVEAIVKVDYISKTKDDKLVVSDWKTGADNEEYESDLQIGTYVLWAMENYGKDPEEIRSELIYLTTGVMRSYEFSVKQLEEIKGKIVEDFEIVNKRYDIDYFPPDPNPKKCLSCQFATVCPHSMAIEQLNR